MVLQKTRIGVLANPILPFILSSNLRTEQMLLYLRHHFRPYLHLHVYLSLYPILPTEGLMTTYFPVFFLFLAKITSHRLFVHPLPAPRASYLAL